MKKTGKVINIEKRKVYIVTEDNEFVLVRRGDKKPVKGEIYTGELIKLNKAQKRLFVFLFLVFICLSVFVMYSYLTPKATLVVDMKATYKLKINKYDKIINISDLNSKKGKELLSSVHIKGKDINSGLINLFKASKGNGIINDKFVENNGQVIVYILDDTGLIKNGNSVKINLSPFESELNSNNIPLIINNRGENSILMK